MSNLNNKKEKLAIFDMDGTLFDTKNVNFAAYSKAIETCGYKVEIDYKYYCDFCNGNNYKVFLPQIVPEITAEDMKRVHAIKKDIYPDYLELAIKNDHLFNMIKLMRTDYTIALVTTASRQNVGDILGAFGVSDVFDLILTQEDVTKTKPDPQGFLLAMEKCGVSKKNTLIFEDSDTGIEAANKSGANFVRVYGFN